MSGVGGKPVLPAAWRQAIEWLARRFAARLKALPPRDRLALCGAAFALLGAVEWFYVLPMRAQRQTIAAATAEQVRAEGEALDTRERQRSQAEAALEARLAEIDKALAAHGAGRERSETLHALLARALVAQSARILSLRDSGVEALDLTPVSTGPGEGAAAAGGAADSAAAAAAPAAAVASGGGVAAEGVAAEAQPQLFRHRYELMLAGDATALTSALERLSQVLPPLRIERVRLAGRPDGSVEATLTLMVIATERTWLTL